MTNPTGPATTRQISYLRALLPQVKGSTPEKVESLLDGITKQDASDVISRCKQSGYATDRDRQPKARRPKAIRDRRGRCAVCGGLVSAAEAAASATGHAHFDCA